MSKKLEIACFNLESALIAAKAGAHRIEFCADCSTGGVTPNTQDVKKLLSQVEIPVFIMIRPRAGNYVFTDEEYEHYLYYIPLYRQLGVQGFVFGLLNPDHSIDKKRNIRLVELASPLPCTFHRAFDLGNDLQKSLEDVISCGFERLLTSGGPGNAIENIPALVKLSQLANGRIGILPGGGVRSSNIEELFQVLTNEFHTSAITKGGEIADDGEIKKILALL